MPFRLRSILVASDLSSSASLVLQGAASLAALAESELHVIHAVESASDRTEGDADAEAQLQEGRRMLHEQLRTTISPMSQATSSRVEPGRGDTVILDRAEEVGADLIVIGPHRGGEQGRELGTTADRLVRSSTVPCLIVHAPITLPLHRILIPTDFSDAGRGSLDEGLTWSAALRVPSREGDQTRADIVHVRGRGRNLAEADRELQAAVRAACDRTGCTSGFTIVQEVVDGDDATDAILRLTRDRDIDLLVLGTHGEGAHGREHIGSVSSAVARDATCPVLLVPPAHWLARKQQEEALQRG